MTSLTLDGCRTRQERLIERMRVLGLNGALIRHPRHVHYFCGFWHPGRPLFETALLVRSDGSSVLCLPFSPASEPTASEVVTFEPSRCATLIEDQNVTLAQTMAPYLEGPGRVGCDVLDALVHPSTGTRFQPLGEEIRSLRRSKDRDEVDVLRAALDGCSAAYSRAREILKPGLTEVELYARMQAAAVEAVGEPITEFGNDFQCGSLGSLPRNRAVEAGEMAILDVSVVLRGYSSDLCRTFVIGAEPTASQVEAHRSVVGALEHVEDVVRPGVSCKRLYEDVFKMLDGHRGWTFGHHLGHGIGLTAHEAPRLNPHWDDTFAVGDVFTAEPGLYGAELRAGVRVEHNYLVTEDGVERLSDYPTDLFVT